MTPELVIQYGGPGWMLDVIRRSAGLEAHLRLADRWHFNSQELRHLSSSLTIVANRMDELPEGI